MIYKIFSFMALAASVCSFSLSGFEGNLHVETFQGSEIIPHTKAVTKFNNTIFKEHPYFYNGSDTEYAKHFASYGKAKDGVVSIAFDGDKIVGVAAGMPLSEAWSRHQEPFRKNGDDISKIYYLGQLFVLPEYMGQGLGQQMGRNIEAFAKSTGKFSTIAAHKIDEAMVQADAPEKYNSSTSILKKLGYHEHPELNFISYWTNINETKESPHRMVYWTKTL